MKSTEERLTELEQKIENLETIVEKYMKEKSIDNIEKETFTINVNNKQSLQQNINRPNNPIINKDVQPDKQNTYYTKKEFQIKEALVGKYLIGALASLLVFVGAISLVGLIWNDLTPEMKLLIISSIGFILTFLGFWLIRTKKNPITSIILGTGAGLLFISILSANMAFDLIGSNTAIILAGVWAIFFILSSRYNNVYFTTIIAYIGSYIALVLGLTLIKGDVELLVMTIFATCISAVMIFNGLKTNNNRKDNASYVYRNHIELIISIILSFINYITISLRCSFDGIYSEQLLDYYFIQMAVMIIIYIIMNIIFKLTDDEKKFPLHVGLSFVVTLITIFYIDNLSENYLQLNLVTCFSVFFLISLVQMVVVNGFFHKISNILTIFYTFILVITSLIINVEMMDNPVGLIIVGLLLLAIERIWKRNNYSIMISLIILLDSLLLFFYESKELICFVYGVLQIALIIYLLWESNCHKKFEIINLLKTIGIVAIILNSFSISRNLLLCISNFYINDYLDKTIGYLFAIIIFVIFYRYHYFKNWKDESFKLFDKNTTLKNDKDMNILFYILTFLLYFIGINGINSVDNWYEHLIFIMTTVVIALIQSHNIILYLNKENEEISGIWIGIKYLLLTWIVLGSFLDLNVTSVLYSLVGLIVAITSIIFGFKFKLKSLRLYGLILTIIMVVKFILVDLYQENSIARVIALIIGGLICFLISLIYNKIEKSTTANK